MTRAFHVIASAILFGSCSASSLDRDCHAPDPSWKNFEAITIGDFHRAWNTLSVDQDGKAHWNGTAADPSKVQEYLGLLAQLKPQPLLIYKPSPGAPCAETIFYRTLVSRMLKCSETADCGEGDQFKNRPLSGDPGV
jgi:hypothetical protein